MSQPIPVIDSANHFGVVAKGEIVFVGNILVRDALRIPIDEALNLAAWISVIADPDGQRFGALVKKIKET